MDKFIGFLEGVHNTSNAPLVEAIAKAYMTTHPHTLNEGKLGKLAGLAGVLGGMALGGHAISDKNIDHHTASVIEDIKAIKAAEENGDIKAKDIIYAHLKPRLFRVEVPDGEHRVFITKFGTFDDNGNPL